jgi:hypothetical protein
LHGGYGKNVNKVVVYFRDKCRQTVKVPVVIGHGKRKRGGDEQLNRTQRHEGTRRVRYPKHLV